MCSCVYIAERNGTVHSAVQCSTVKQAGARDNVVLPQVGARSCPPIFTRYYEVTQATRLDSRFTDRLEWSRVESSRRRSEINNRRRGTRRAALCTRRGGTLEIKAGGRASLSSGLPAGEIEAHTLLPTCCLFTSVFTSADGVNVHVA